MSVREPFFSYGYAEIQNASDRITDNIEKLNEYIQDLEEFEEKLGSKSDTRDMRKRMNDKKYKANELVKQTKDLFNELKDAQPKKADDREFKNKVFRRLNENFTNEHNKFTKLLKNISLKEKRFIETKKSMLMEGKLKGSVASDRSGYSQEEETELAAQIQDLDYTETLLKDREHDIQDVRKLAYELNLTAQFQAQKVAEASNDIEVIDNDTGFTEKKTEEALRNLDKVYEQQKKTSKKNLVLCCVITFICAVIIAVIVSQMSD